MKNYILTGDSRGIGAALAERWTKKGNVRYLGLSRTSGVDLSQSLSKDLLRRLVKDHGLQPLDGIILNAGSSRIAPATLVNVIDLAHDLWVNFISAVELVQAAFPFLKQGAVVYAILTNNLEIHPPMYLSYNCSKAALAEFIHTLPKESDARKKELKTAGLILGAVDTEMYREACQQDYDLRDLNLKTLSTEEAAQAIEETLQIAENADFSDRPFLFRFDKNDQSRWSPMLAIFP